MSIQLEDIEHDITVEDLLLMILNELKIMNAYNAMAHDEIIEEIEDGI